MLLFSNVTNKLKWDMVIIIQEDNGGPHPRRMPSDLIIKKERRCGESSPHLLMLMKQIFQTERLFHKSLDGSFKLMVIPAGLVSGIVVDFYVRVQLTVFQNVPLHVD